MRVELTVMVYSLGVRPGITFPWKSNRDVSAERERERENDRVVQHA